MRNEDFNEVADDLALEVSTNRRERVFNSNLVQEIRALWKRIEELEGSSPTKTTKKVTKKKATTQS